MKNDSLMKSWVAPAMEEVKLADTQYGSSTETVFDNVYQNADGAWEATFALS